MLNLSNFTWRILIGGTVIIGALLLGLYNLDQNNSGVLEWMDYAEIILGWGVLVIIMPCIDWASGIGERYGRKRGVMSFAITLLLSALLGVGALIAFFALILGASPAPLSEYTLFESLGALTNPSPTILWMLAISISYCWLFSNLGYFEKRT